MDIKEELADLCCAVVLSGKLRPEDVIKTLTVQAEKGANAKAASDVLRIFAQTHTDLKEFLKGMQALCWFDEADALFCLDAALSTGVGIATAKPRPSVDNVVIVAEPKEETITSKEKRVLQLIWTRARTERLNAVGKETEVKQDAYKQTQNTQAGFDINAPGLAGLKRNKNQPKVQAYIDQNGGKVRKPRSSSLAVSRAAKDPESPMSIVQLKIPRPKTQVPADEINLSRVYWAPHTVALFLKYISEVNTFLQRLAKEVRVHMKKGGDAKELYAQLPTQAMKDLADTLYEQTSYMNTCKANDHAILLMCRFGFA